MSLVSFIFLVKKQTNIFLQKQTYLKPFSRCMLHIQMLPCLLYMCPSLFIFFMSPFLRQKLRISMAGEGGWGQQEQGSFFYSPLINVNSSFDPNQRSVISHLHITKATVFAYCKRERTCICMRSLVSKPFSSLVIASLSVSDTISSPLQSQKVATGQHADRDKMALASYDPALTDKQKQ